MRTRLLTLTLLGLGLIVLTACHKNVFTRDRFEMIQQGVDNKEDVARTIGKPTSDLGDQWLYDDQKRFHAARIFFDEDGRVRGKEWMDTKTGTWEGQNPDANEPPQGEVRERDKKTTRIKKD